ncbi:peptide-methionine (S)-S-oxide reductase MsrA [Wenzhouxiangella sp. AB-CW3]|nr:peptide-methionine (S)-S-oxide reductase MsrA [Wenzhouxiangella sp. AB-CW3]
MKADQRRFTKWIGLVPMLMVSIVMADAIADRDSEERLQKATFAGGCFWCMEPPYDRLDGVVETISGFSGGHVSEPSYEAVVRGVTGHREVVQVIYDPGIIDYDTLLQVFWRNIDPLDDGGQFCDRGSAYRTAIFAHDAGQLEEARASLVELEQSGRFDEPIVTPVIEFENFYAAEDYHQGYYQNNPVRYRYYRWRCGRDARLTELWGEEAGGKP